MSDQRPPHHDRRERLEELGPDHARMRLWRDRDRGGDPRGLHVAGDGGARGAPTDRPRRGPAPDRRAVGPDAPSVESPDRSRPSRRDECRGDRVLGPPREVRRQTAARPAGRSRAPAHTRLRQRLVQRRSNARCLRRAGSRDRGAWIPGPQVRPVRGRRRDPDELGGATDAVDRGRGPGGRRAGRVVDDRGA